MFKCAWCKKESITPSDWSEDKEPLCSECAPKYHFGLSHNMLSRKVSDLSKDQRQEVSAAINDIRHFRGAVRSMEREVLTGRSRTIARIGAWVLGIAALGAGGASTAWIYNETLSGLAHG